MYLLADEFSSPVDALKADGWHAVTLDQPQGRLRRGLALGPGKPLVITF